MDFSLNSLIEATNSLPKELKESLTESLSILFETKDKTTKYLAWHTVIDLVLWNDDSEDFSFEILEKNEKAFKEFHNWLQKPKGLNVEINLGK
jgi:hypothetical protein